MEGKLVVNDKKISNKRGREDEEDKGRGLEKRPSGVIVIEEYSYSGDEMINGVKYEEEKETTPTSQAHTGLFNQLITSLVNNTPTSKSSEEVESEKKCNASGEVAKDGNNIDNIVARLPRTLSEDTVPAADEASILIHSIIHD